MKHKLVWFTNRIGKKVYRDKNRCSCDTCKKVFENGLKILDKQHAEYLSMVQYELDINYRDKK